MPIINRIKKYLLCFKEENLGKIFFANVFSRLLKNRLKSKKINVAKKNMSTDFFSSGVHDDLQSAGAAGEKGGQGQEQVARLSIHPSIYLSIYLSVYITCNGRTKSK